jgi:hypothetical protein
MICCLCRNKAIHTESRPSGKDGKLETWHFCEECRKESERQRADTTPEICQSYKIFLQFLCGYRMQRAFYGNPVADVTPGKRNIDPCNHISISSPHEKTSNEHTGGASQETQAALCRHGQEYDDYGAEPDRGLLEEGRRQNEKIITLEAGP